MEDVDCRVAVPVVGCAAFRALPLPDMKILHLRVLMPASGADLAAGKEPRHSHNRASVPLGLVLQHSDEFTPSSIADRACQLVITYHSLDIKIFDCDHLVFVNESSTPEGFLYREGVQSQAFPGI